MKREGDWSDKSPNRNGNYPFKNESYWWEITNPNFMRYLLRTLPKVKFVRFNTKRYDQEVYKEVENDPEISKLSQKIQNGEKLTREQEILLDTAINRALYTAKRDFYKGVQEGNQKNIKNENKREKIGNWKEEEYIPKKHPVTGQILPPGYEIIKE